LLPRLLESRRVDTRISLIAVFSALAVGTDYAMGPLPNIKLMDALVFVAAFLFGIRVGAGVAVSTWLIYGFANPWGLPSMILLFQIIGETFYAIAGAFLRRTSLSKLVLRKESSSTGSRREHLFASLILGTVGLFSSLAYDILTNTATWFINLYNPTKDLASLLAQSFTIGLITMNFPLPLGIMHQASDLVFFALVTPVVVKAANKLGRLPS